MKTKYHFKNLFTRKPHSQKPTKFRSLLLFKNILKNAWQFKLQLLGLIVLIFLSGFIITTVSISNTRLFGNYQTFIRQSNQHQFITDFNNITVKINSTQGDLGAFNGQTDLAEQAIFQKLALNQPKSSLNAEQSL